MIQISSHLLLENPLMDKVLWTKLMKMPSWAARQETTNLQEKNPRDFKRDKYEVYHYIPMEDRLLVKDQARTYQQPPYQESLTSDKNARKKPSNIGIKEKMCAFVEEM